MSFSNSKSIAAAVKNCLLDQVDSDGNLNPTLLALASRCYRIQSHVLHVPDNWGFFSPGPPRLQVHQGAGLVVVLGLQVHTAALGGFVVYMLVIRNRPVFGLVGFLLAMHLATLVAFWALSLFDRHRAIGYDWGDGKLRKE